MPLALLATAGEVIEWRVWRVRLGQGL